MVGNLFTYPCNRGMTLPVGYHHFQLTPGAARSVCIYCGELGKGPSFDVTTTHHTKDAPLS